MNQLISSSANSTEKGLDLESEWRKEWAVEKWGVNTQGTKADSDAYGGIGNHICPHDFHLLVPPFLQEKLMVKALKLLVPHFNIFLLII